VLIAEKGKLHDRATATAPDAGKHLYNFMERK